ncbi:MAG: hypothetical protein KKE11_04920 [Gammaproteobacteria bacterium]|nr:hypothetical protein [Gammaproteobacteria bacterium]
MTLYNLKHSEVILISGGLRCECFLTQRYGNPQPSRIKDRFRDRMVVHAKSGAAVAVA